MPTFDQPEYYKHEELVQIDPHPPQTAWMDTPIDPRPGTYIYPAKPKNLKVMDFPHAREWHVREDDWHLPDDWKKIILEGMADRLKKYRSFKVFMDTCVRCGACADKCHFFIGS
ncbi:MAG: (Fe-S)-binding protein, partial [Planctomycetota bacterium]